MVRFCAAVFAIAFHLSLPAAAAVQNPVLLAHVGENDDETVKTRALAITRLDIEVDIRDGIAVTTVTSAFLNSGKEELEGDFIFDLPRGAVVTGYALDVGGKMIDGVLAEARKAERVYESVVRRGVDPGLARISQAGTFSTRVFPILAGKTRTIRLKFVTPVLSGRSFVLPLATAYPIGSGFIRVRVADTASPPRVIGPAGPMIVAPMKDGFEASARWKAHRLQGAISVGPIVASRPMTVSRHANEQAFFQIDDVLPVGHTRKRDRVRVYWDSSRSRKDQDLSAEISLASQYITQARARGIELVQFADGKPVIRSFASVAEFKAALQGVAYGGATAATSFQQAEVTPADVCLFFSDGNFTLDPWRPQQMPCVTHAISAAKDANRGYLRAMANASGGHFIDLASISFKSALTQLLRDNSARLIMEGRDGSKLDFVRLSADGGRFRLIGLLPAQGDVFVSIPGRPARRYAAPRQRIARNDAPGALWAAQKIEEMSATDQPQRDRILDLARRFSVASPVASFVVLEEVRDYVNLGIEPPAAFGEEFRLKYRTELAEQQEEKAKEQAERFDDILEMWNKQKKWWETKFVYKRPKPVPVQRVPTRPSPAPPAMAEGGRGGGSDSIELTTVTARKREGGASIEVKIAPWDSKRPYVTALKDLTGDNFWKAYREQEAKEGNLPVFYLDIAELLHRRGQNSEAINVLLNALDLSSADFETLTIVADRLMRYGDHDRAIWLHERVVNLEPYRPQPQRNLALALVARADVAAKAGAAADAARRDYARALKLLSAVVLTDGETDYDGIEIIALMEANHLIPRLRALGGEITLDSRLVAHLDVDLRVVLEWSTAATDMDLWVDEPTGERSYYSKKLTGSGGRLSNDMTSGFGPEEYLIRRAPDGEYKVQVDVYSTDRLNPNGATTIRAHVFRNYGRADERVDILEVELSRDNKEDPKLIGTIKVKR